MNIGDISKGRYWLSVHVSRHDRVVRSISIDARETREEHVQLKWSNTGRSDATTTLVSGDSLSWSDSCATGSVALWLRPMSPMGDDLATEVVVCAREGLLDGMRHEFVGRIDLTLASRGTGRLQIRARGFAPRFFASDSVIMTSAAAPSEIDEEVAAVTVPSLLKAGRSVGIFSTFTLNGVSSSLTTSSPLRRMNMAGVW